MVVSSAEIVAKIPFSFYLYLVGTVVLPQETARLLRPKVLENTVSSDSHIERAADENRQFLHHQMYLVL